MALKIILHLRWPVSSGIAGQLDRNTQHGHLAQGNFSFLGTFGVVFSKHVPKFNQLFSKCLIFSDSNKNIERYHKCDIVKQGVQMGLEREVENLPFLSKLKYVVDNGELDFWEDRKNPPNLSVDQFRLVLRRSTRAINLKWIDRISENGMHGKTGEEKCFKFSCQITFGGVFDIKITNYFIKGYFFEKGNLIGVTIQSFREDSI